MNVYEGVRHDFSESVSFKTYCKQQCSNVAFQARPSFKLKFNCNTAKNIHSAKTVDARTTVD